MHMRHGNVMVASPPADINCSSSPARQFCLRQCCAVDVQAVQQEMFNPRTLFVFGCVHVRLELLS